jgi:hypothetical protein
MPTKLLSTVLLATNLLVWRGSTSDAGVVGAASRNDAAHIALATIFGAELVVSWNFKHIVHFEKIAGYEGVNSLRGYRSPKIYSSREVVKS